MERKIIVATDGSAVGGRAVALAAELSGKLDRPLCVVHVLMYGRPTREFEAMAAVEGLAPAIPAEDASGGPATHGSPMDRFPAPSEKTAHGRAVSALGDRIVAEAKIRAVEGGARGVTAHICSGDVADEILDVAEVEKAKIVVLGRRGLGRVREMVLGSVSQKVLHHTDRTVVIVP